MSNFVFLVESWHERIHLWDFNKCFILRDLQEGQPPQSAPYDSGGRASSASRDAPLDPQGASGRASRGGIAAQPPLAATRPPPGAAATRGDAPASMGRGASRGREAREPNIVTRPSPEFIKMGKLFE